MVEHPEVNDFVRLDFDGDQSPIRGRVTEVDTDPDIRATQLLVTVEDSANDRTVLYGEGELYGDEWANVSATNKQLIYGENAIWSPLE